MAQSNSVRWLSSGGVLTVIIIPCRCLSGPKVLAICVCILSFACDNLELDAIIAWTLARADVSLPASNRRDSADALRPFSCDDPLVLRFTLGFTAVTAVLDFISAILPAGTKRVLQIEAIGVRLMMHADHLFLHVSTLLTSSETD